MSGETKVVDVAAQLRNRIPVSRNSFMKFYDWYHATYFKPGRIAPLFHAMIGIGALGYAIEYPHIKHELEEQKKQATQV